MPVILKMGGLFYNNILFIKTYTTIITTISRKAINNPLLLSSAFEVVVVVVVFLVVVVEVEVDLGSTGTTRGTPFVVVDVSTGAGGRALDVVGVVEVDDVDEVVEGVVFCGGVGKGYILDIGGPGLGLGWPDTMKQKSKSNTNTCRIKKQTELSWNF